MLLHPPGIIPKFIKFSAKKLFDIILKSHIQAKSKPAPIAGPLTTAITGTSILIGREIALGIFCIPYL